VKPRGLTFGAVAAAYERYRPGYPDELVDAVLEYAGHPIRTAFEIGAGTGKATRAFAARGIKVTATDPDEAMLDELRRHVPADGVEVIQCTLEGAPTASTYDLVFAGASLHWTDPHTRWTRVAGLLRPAGVVASFGGPGFLAAPALEAAVKEATAEFLKDDAFPSPDSAMSEAAMQWPGNELVESPLFTDVQQHTVPRRQKVSAGDYIGLLSTVSAYLLLTPDARAAAFEAIRAVLPPEVEMVGDIWLHLARRA
jgi:SAM-dependent methyltransferase